MKITARATAPMDQEFEMTITMTLAQWQQLLEQMYKGGETYYGPAGTLRSAINAINVKAKTTFTESIEQH